MRLFTKSSVGWLAGMLLLLAPSLYAQVYTQRLPTGTATNGQYGALGPDAPVPKSTLQTADTAPLLADDKRRDKLGLPARLGVDVAANVDLIPVAVKSVKSGYRVASYQFDIPNALGVSVVFDDLQLVAGARLFIYNADRTVLIGPVTSEQNGPTFWSDLLEGSSAVVEVQEPAETVGQSRVHVAKLVQYYRFAPRFGFGTSDACEINTICYPSYQNEADGVNMLLTNYSPYTYACTGAIVNSTRQDFRSYLLTAFHCYDFSEDGVQQPGELAAAANTQVRFHWESPTCATAADNVYLTLTGANFRSAYANSDFTLLELTQQVPPAENITYLGWDRGGALPSSPFGIHHPSADIKKISFSPNATTLVNVTPGASYIVNAGTTHLQVTWAGAPNNLGVTEGGSSGSPLFDSNRRIVGQLHGGGSYCDAPTSPDQYGRVFTSWTGGGTSATRLSDWLDPTSAGGTTTNSVKSQVAGPATLAGSGSFSLNAASSVTSWTVTGGAGVVSPMTGTGNVANLTGLTSGSNLTITFGISAGQSYAIRFTKTFNVMVVGNTAPTVANPIPAQSATVNQFFSYAIPASTFTDTETPGSLVLSVSGLPAGLNFTAPATISGTPTAPGNYNVNVTATDPGSLSVSTMFTLAVSASAVTPTGPATLTITSFSCGYSPSVLSSVSFVVGYSNGSFSPALAPLFINGVTASGQLGQSYSFGFDANAAPVAIQDNASRSTYFTWDFRTACTTGVTPPTPTAPVAPALPNLMATQGSPFSYVVPTFGGTTPISYAATGLTAGLNFNATSRTISGTPLTAGVSTVTITASNVAGQGSGTFTLTVSASAVTPTGPATLTITSFSCGYSASVLSSVSFMVGYSNGTFSPALAPLFINGVTASGQLGQSYSFGFDANAAPVAIQDNASRSTYFIWDFRTACANRSVAARLAVEPVDRLRLNVRGNPVQETMEVEVTGAQGSSLQVLLSDMQGRTLGQQRIEQASAHEQVRFNVSQQPTGVLLLRAITPTQSQAVRVLKAK